MKDENSERFGCLLETYDSSQEKAEIRPLKRLLRGELILLET